MKLTYRGNSYETNDRLNSNSNSTDKPPIKLICRGQAYCYNPRSVVTSEEVEAEGKNVTLFYRGTSYEQKIQTSKSNLIPLALNWRWHCN